MTLIISEQKRIPIGRLGVPEEISSIVEMLVLNAYMTNKASLLHGFCDEIECSPLE